MRNVSFIKRRRQRNVLCFLLFLLVVITDQASKLLAMNNLQVHEYSKVFSWFNFTLSFNKGVSFSMLNSHDTSLIIGISIFCIVLLTWACLKFNDVVERVFLSLIMGGAIGNLIDRFIHGAVVDFIDVYMPSEVLQKINSYIKIFSERTVLFDWHFPTFNIADSFISVATVGLIIYNLFKK